MNKIEDVQSQASPIHLTIQQVGIRSYKQPITFSDSLGTQHAVATFDLLASLTAEERGTHMSRFIQVALEHKELSYPNFIALGNAIRQRLDAEQASVIARFDYFRHKTAPVSGISAPVDYSVKLATTANRDGSHALTITVTVPTTSLCPCSKKISDYGAHNQRSHTTLTCRLQPAPQPLELHELITLAEQHASSQLYSVLKREDEKYVTEYAYDHPMFVEDMVRNLADALNKNDKVASYTVESENFESIHNHNAYAKIDG